MPVNNNAGNVNNPPPPAKVSINPASNATANNNKIISIAILFPIVKF